jgi:hypothetical protein
MVSMNLEEINEMFKIKEPNTLIIHLTEDVSNPAKRMVHAVRFLTHVQEVITSNLGWDTGHPHWCLLLFYSVPPEYLKLGHNHFSSFLIIVHCHPIIQCY